MLEKARAVNNFIGFMLDSSVVEKSAKLLLTRAISASISQRSTPGLIFERRSGGVGRV